MSEGFSMVKEPRILIVSNNSLSETKNNGKTIASIFKCFDQNNIAQLYFSDESPDIEKFNIFFNISDSFMISSLIKKKAQYKVKINNRNNKNSISRKLVAYLNRFFNQSNFLRLIREILWSSNRWNSVELNLWLNSFSPELIFFCAGDSIFAYKIMFYIKKKFGAKLITFITDDYILKRTTINIFWKIRRNMIFRFMSNAVKESDLFATISFKMRSTYKEIFNKESIVLNNSIELLNENVKKNINHESIILTYAGSLHSKRHITLAFLAKAIKINNFEGKTHIYLKIYSNTIPSKKILRSISVEDSSVFLGSLNKKELEIVLNNSDILVHVESFSKKSIETTLLSLSTKIPEYMSFRKPILAIGPKQVASMHYLSDIAFCINSPKEILSDLKRMISDTNLLDSLSELAFNKYIANHTYQNSINFRSEIIKLFQ
jgi:hypothetical protein